MARRTAVASAVCAFGLAVFAPSAFAHAGNPNYESLVRGVSPNIPGFSVEVLNGDDRLAVQNTGSETVTIDGYSKDPYVRLSSGGKVEVNTRSPAYYLNQDRDYGASVPASASATAPPKWSVVANTGRYEFHDHRMHWMAKSTPQQVTDTSKRTKIVDWHVPLHATGPATASGAIDGELFWRGTGPGAPIGAFIAFGALVLLGGAFVVVVRRRRAAADGGGSASAGGSGAGATKPRGEAW